ncbi:hypothetical protein ABZY31_18800 [Streptomyces sp. NPDC006529]|uniref:hypothetical protein n=1 Tax=Streptomyces sp. NPDC006529 TaxID=3157177 RepID=UPI0033BF3BC8
MNAPASTAPAGGDAQEWQSALLRLLDDPYVFAAAGARRHPDWAADVLAVLRRENADPREWAGLDWDRDGEERAAAGPSFPFRAGLTPDGLRAALHPLEHAAAVDLLASLTQEWTFEPAPLYGRAPAEREAVREDARTLLRRFGPGGAASYWTTSRLARTTTAPDFLRARLEGGGTPLTDYAEEVGLIVTAPPETGEVGVFWSFNAT